MKTEQAHESCPFCGAGIFGVPQSGVMVFCCGTAVSPGNVYTTQPETCRAAERDRLTRERDEAIRDFNESQKSLEIATNQIAQMARDNNQLLARVKRLEEAGDWILAIAEHKVWADDSEIDKAISEWNKAKEAKP